MNLSKRAPQQFFNVDSCKHGVTNLLNVRNILMTSMHFYKLVLLFCIFHHNFSNVNVDNSFKSYITRKSFSRKSVLNYDSFIYHNVNIFNISHTKVLSSSDGFYLFSFYFVNIPFL